MPASLLLALLGGCAHRVPPHSASFHTELDRRVEDARWLMAYDMVAWVTSDALVASDPDLTTLGREWFAWQDDAGTWFAAYGRFDPEQDRHVPVAWYRAELEGGQLVPTAMPGAPDPALADPLGRALALVFASDLGPVSLERYAYNWYARRTPDAIEVFVIPAHQPDGTLVIGNSALFRLDPEGRAIERREDYAPGFAELTISAEAVVDLPCTTEIPSVFELYWARYYADDFERFLIRCPTSVFTFDKEHRALVIGTPTGRAAVPSVVTDP